MDLSNIPLTPREIFLVVFLTGMGLFLYFDRHKVQRHYILVFRRTKKGIELIDRIAKKAPRFWNVYGWSGVVTGFLSAILGTYLFATTIGNMITSRSVENGPSLILPGLVAENQFQAGVSLIPIEYWVFGIAIIMVVHEMSHGIIARLEGFEINSVGWFVFGIFPGAFVEPKGENMLPGGDPSNVDEEHGMWDQGNWKSRLKVLGAGSFANYVTAALLIGLAFGAQSALTEPTGVIYQAQPDYPAYDSGMRNGTLVAINGQQINTLADLQNVSGTIDVNQTVSVWTDEGNFTMTADSWPEETGREGGYIGIQVGSGTVIKPEYEGYQGALQWAISGLFTIGLLNFLIGLFNMMPFKPLDGGLMVETVVEKFFPDKIQAVNTLSLAGWTVILGTLFLSLAVQFL